MSNKRTAKAFKWTAFAMIGKALCAFVQLLALARILAPAEFGIIAITMMLLSTARIVSDLGISSALIHYSDSTKEEEAHLYWFNILCGIIFTVLLMLSASPIARFYGDTSLIPLILIGSFHFIIWSFGQQFRTLSERSLSFRALSIIEVVSFAFGTVLAITLALKGFGAYSVVWGFISTAAINSISSIIFLSESGIPGVKLNFKKIRRFLFFGVRVLMLSLVNTTALQSDIAISGRLLGLENLGSYYQPRELCLRIMFVINPIVTRVTFPLMASQKGDVEKLKETYIHSILITNSINFPIYGAIFILSQEVTFLALGPQWAESAQILALLALWSGIRSVGNPISSLLLALGKTKLALKSATSVLICLSITILIGANWRFEGIVIGMTVFYALLIPAFWFFLVRRTISVRFWEYHAAVFRPLMSAFFACVLTKTLLNLLSLGDIWNLIVGSAFGLILYIGLTIVLNKDFIVLLRQYFGGVKV